MTKVVTGVLAAVLGSAVQAWMLMLALGGVHHSVWYSVPALGYWQTVIATVTVSLIGMSWRAGIQA